MTFLTIGSFSTPFSVLLGASSRAEAFEFRLAGHRPEQRQVPVIDGNRVEAILAVERPVEPPPAVAAPRPQPKRRAPMPDRSAVLNPFK